MQYWPFELSEWIALDDLTLENGCVRHAAGSNELGLLPHRASGAAGNSVGLVPDDRVLELSEHAKALRSGDCPLRRCLTVHRSEPNRSAALRRGLIYTFISPRVRLAVRPGHGYRWLLVAEAAEPKKGTRKKAGEAPKG